MFQDIGTFFFEILTVCFCYCLKNQGQERLTSFCQYKREARKIECFSHLCYFVNRAGAMSLNPVVPKVANIRIDWFHCIKSQKSSGSIAPFSKIEWFHGTTGTTTNASPGPICTIATL